MKNKIMAIFVFAILSYAVPLSAQINLLFSWQVFVLLAVASILFLTQPEFSIKETREKISEDKLSIIAILLGSVLCQVVSVIEWAYFHKSHEFNPDVFTFTGMALLIGGTIFRVWCIQTLGKYFTATVQAQVGQRIIKRGAYALIRHPSYLGAYLALVGSAIFLHAIVGTIITTILMLIVYLYRIRTEENLLVKEFGQEYIDYQIKTKMIFPYIY